MADGRKTARSCFQFFKCHHAQTTLQDFFSLQVHKGTPILNLAANYNIVICYKPCQIASERVGVAQWRQMHLINYMNDTRALEEMASNNLERTN